MKNPIRAARPKEWTVFPSPPIWIAALAALLPAGCGGGDALVEMSAADALESLAQQTRKAIDEYHADLSLADDSREMGVIAAFIERTRRDAQDDSRMTSDTRDFMAALAKLRADRQTAWQRHAAAGENTAQVEEVAAGLRKLAVQSLSLRDEWDRYIGKFIEARRRAAAASAANSAAATGNTPAPLPTPAPVAAAPSVKEVVHELKSAVKAQAVGAPPNPPIPPLSKGGQGGVRPAK